MNGRYVVPTALFVAAPGWWLDTDLDWTRADLRVWSEGYYEWAADPFGGWLDIAQAPQTTLDRGRGDCVDYARLVASVLTATTDHRIVLGVHWGDDGHVTLYDETDGTLFSSGNIHDETVEEYAERTGYRLLWKKEV